MEPKVFTAEDLSNADMTQFDGSVSDADIAKIHATCPAKWKFGPEPDSKESSGLLSHIAILDDEKFNSRYYRDLDIKNYPYAVNSINDAKSWLKRRGIGGASNKDREELMEMIRQVCGDEVSPVWDDILADAQKVNAGKSPISPTEYDKIVQMRSVIFADNEYRAALTGAYPNMTFLCEMDGVPVRVKVDMVTPYSGLWDYTTTNDLSKLPRLAYENKLYARMAMRHDVFEIVTGNAPSECVFLVQETTEPFIPQAFRMQKWQLEAGRDQYKAALALYKACKESDIWPAYGGGIQELDAPEYVKRMYNI
jgi:hypothetical protein